MIISSLPLFTSNVGFWRNERNTSNERTRTLIKFENSLETVSTEPLQRGTPAFWFCLRCRSYSFRSCFWCCCFGRLQFSQSLKMFWWSQHLTFGKPLQKLICSPYSNELCAPDPAWNVDNRYKLINCTRTQTNPAAKCFCAHLRVLKLQITLIVRCWRQPDRLCLSTPSLERPSFLFFKPLILFWDDMHEFYSEEVKNVFLPSAARTKWLRR